MLERFEQLAKEAAGELGIPWQWIYAQWAHETGGFTSPLAKNHYNYAGLTSVKGGYRSYSSDEEFVNSYVNDFLKKSRYSGAVQAQSVEDFVKGLKAGGYFTDVLENYLYGVKFWLSDTPAVLQSTPVIPGGEINSRSDTWITEQWIKVKKALGIGNKPGDVPIDEEIAARLWAGLPTEELESAYKNSPAGQTGTGITDGFSLSDFPKLFTGGLMVLAGVAAGLVGFFLMTRKEG